MRRVRTKLGFVTIGEDDVIVDRNFGKRGKRKLKARKKRHAKIRAAMKG